jgi:hypothetical protein
MVELLVFVPPVLSALLGAVAIRGVEILSARRSGYEAIQHEIRENYFRIEGEIIDIDQNNWSDYYKRRISLDAIEAVKARSPGVYIEIINEVDRFPETLSALEYIRREQVESRRPGATVSEDSEVVKDNLQEIQRLLIEADEELTNHLKSNKIRSLLYSTAIEDQSLEKEAKKDEISTDSSAMFLR